MWVRVAQVLALAAVLLSVGSAKAWVSTTIQSDAAVVTVDQHGEALVEHELRLRVGGGPLRSFTLGGVDLDAAPQAGAQLVRARSGPAGQHPIPLLLQRDEAGTLTLELDHEKGVFRGTYLVTFSYRTKLLQRGLIQLRGSRARVRWVGPRFEDGIDSAMVTFRFAAAPEPPRLPRDADRSEELGTFLSTLRRAGDRDELELVRPHVAQGEPVVWQVEVDAAAVSPRAVRATVKESVGPRRRTVDRSVVLGGLAAVVALLGLILFWKGRASAAAATRRGSGPRWLVPAPLALRAALFGGMVAGAIAAVWLRDWVSVGGALHGVALLLATQLPARERTSPRGPGRWVELDDAAAFRAPRVRRPGRFLDAGTAAGFVVFLVLLAAFLAGAAYRFPEDPVQALLIALASTVLAPLFLTGGERGLPVNLADAPRRQLGRIAAQLRRRGDLVVVPFARMPAGTRHVDELRLLVRPATALAGLVALEVAIEYQRGAGGLLELPCILVRVRDGSPAKQGLPRGLGWSRGRTADEQVAILRPRLPTRVMTVELVGHLVQRLAQPASKGRNQRPATASDDGHSAARSGGKGAAASNSPTQAA